MLILHPQTTNGLPPDHIPTLMRTVRDESGRHYLLLKASGESSLVRDPETGETTYLDNDRLSPADGESPLSTASRAVPDPVRTVLTACHDDRALGLLLELDDRGPLAVREIMGAYDMCESDVHGVLLEFQAADLIVETTVAGERGYKCTEEAETALTHLRT